MGKKNIVLTKDGMSVGVKHVRDEDYEDKAQRCGTANLGTPAVRATWMSADEHEWNSLLVKAWNYSTWPAYKSRLWNKEAQVQPESRKP